MNEFFNSLEYSSISLTTIFALKVGRCSYNLIKTIPLCIKFCLKTSSPKSLSELIKIEFVDWPFYTHIHQLPREKFQ